MDCHEHIRTHGRLPSPISHFMQADSFAKDSLCGRRPKTYDRAWLDSLYFSFQPRPAGGQLLGRRFLVLSALAEGLPLEVFDRIRHIGLCPGNAGVCQRTIENPSCRSNKGAACPVFLVARLFSHEE